MNKVVVLKILSGIGMAFLGIGFFVGLSFASQPTVISTQEIIKNLIRSKLTIQYPQAKIDITSDLKWVKGESPNKVETIVFHGETAPGIARFRINDSISEVEYSAWMSVPIANRTIKPGERLEPSQFNIQEVDVSKGMARELKGLILGSTYDLRELEAKQTIVEGNYPLLSAVQKIPLIKRGELVRVYMKSNGLMVTTQARAQEPGPEGAMVRVIAERSKKEWVGKVLSAGTVEVEL